MSAVSIIVLIVAIVAVVAGIVSLLGFGIKRDVEHRRRLGRRDRARAGRVRRRA